MDRGACQATVHRVGQSRTQLNWLSVHASKHWARVRIIVALFYLTVLFLEEIRNLIFQSVVQWLGLGTFTAMAWGSIPVWRKEILQAAQWLDGRESGWTPGVGDGQGGLASAIHGVAKSRWLKLHSGVDQSTNWKKRVVLLSRTAKVTRREDFCGDID